MSDVNASTDVQHSQVQAEDQIQSEQYKEELVTRAIASLEKFSLATLIERIKEDWIAHGKDWTRPGFRAIAIYRFGVWRMTIQSKLLRAPLSLLYTMMYRKVRNSYGIEVPFTAKIGRRVVIEHQHGIVIHGFCEIGDDCVIRQGVTLGNRYLERPFEAPKLAARVNVGAGAKVLGAIALGEGASVGANAVVLKDVPAGKTAVGIPAKIL
jgi:serine O-acetyltransferase